MSESVASALEFIDSDATQQTRLFIRMVNIFFDCLNVKGPQMAKLKRNGNIAPYTSPNDHRFKVSTESNQTDQCVLYALLLLVALQRLLVIS